MVYIIPPGIKKIYDKWNIQGFVLFSLTLQTILILFAPFRKRTANVIVTWMIWSAYLLADWAANFAVGLISNRQDVKLPSPSSPSSPPVAPPPLGQNPEDHADILAFWAPFLLLHLGGPDTITAFALEDNALWLRHLVGLVTQVTAAFIVFGQSLPDNKLWLPTVLLFVAGTIKYCERTRALFLANLNKFRESMLKEPDPGPNYAKLMEEYSSKKDAKLPTHIEMIAEPNKLESKTDFTVEDRRKYKLTDAEVVQKAHHFFDIFKGLIVDLIFSFRERHDSRVFFHQRTAEDAYRVIAVELNFMYEVLYTKVLVVHSKLGYFVRFISWCAVVAALVRFYSLNKTPFLDFDVGITYTLLFGAIALDSIALFMLIFSDWTVAALKKKVENIFFTPLTKFLTLKEINWSTTGTTKCSLDRVRQILLRRWSEYLYTFNFIDYSLKERRKTNPNLGDYVGRILNFVINMFGLKEFYDQMKYKSKEPFTSELWDFIFEELRKKSVLADDPETAKRIYSARGDWVLQDSDWNNESNNLMAYVADVDVDYDQSLMLWHIATELCHNTEKDDPADNSRKFCKILSDYMLYLLVMQPTMMSAVAGIGQIRFRDTCAEAKKFFSRRDLGGPEKEHKEACRKILEVNTDVTPVAVKGDRSKSVLFDACILAKELQKLGGKKWKLMSEVWVELLSYAAGHCRANSHAAQLSKGGELITFIWLLMAHFGIGDQFQINEGHARAKLIVGK